MSSPQASTLGDESEPREDPLEQGTSYDEKEFVRKLLESCSNRKEETFNFEDYVTQKGRGLEDLHPKRRQKCYVNREDVLSDFVSKSKYRGRKTATHNLTVFESMVRGHHALAAGLHPSFKDYKWYQDTGDPIAYTTAKHHAVNSLERRIREKITEQWEPLTRRNAYFDNHSDKILPLILQFIRVAPINFNLVEAITHCNETLAYATPKALADGPWSPAANVEREEAINILWEEPEAVNLLSKIRLVTTDKDPHLALFVSDNGIETDTYTRRMLYFLGCNWQKLPKLIKYFKEHSAGARRAKISEDYVAICKPGQSYISNIEKCQSSPHGYALSRGILWRTAFAIECEREIT